MQKKLYYFTSIAIFVFFLLILSIVYILRLNNQLLDYKTLENKAQFLEQSFINVSHLKNAFFQTKDPLYDKEFQIMKSDLQREVSTPLVKRFLIFSFTLSSDLSKYLDTKSTEDFKQLHRIFTEYIHSSEKMFQYQNILGLNQDRGLYGLLRDKVHQLEYHLKNYNDPILLVNMLSMRRHEKDFMLRGDRSYVDKLHQEIRVFQSNLNHSSYKDKKRLLDLSDAYKESFDQFVDYFTMIGLSNHNGLMQHNRELHAQFTAHMKSLTHAFDRHITPYEQRIYSFTLIIFFLSLVLIILIFASRRIILNKEKKNQKKIQAQHKELKALNDHLEDRVTLEINKNKEKEELLLQQSRLAQMGEMIAMIAHQWRQPLSAITTSSSYLRLLMGLKNHKEEDFLSGLAQIELYVQHLSQTIDDFRNFFKPDKKKEQTTLNDLVNKSLAIIGTSLQNNHIEIRLRSNNDHRIKLYAQEMMQVILNLLKNAEDVLLEREIKPAWIEISIFEDEHHHCLSFEDNAQGIPSAIIDKIFDPYFSTKKDKKGTGLGLYMSKVIVKEHCHGTLSAKNTPQGAKFLIKLPKIQAH